MKHLSIVILISVTFFYGCDKDDLYVPVKKCHDLSRNMDTINKYIHGTWKWVEDNRYNRLKNEYEYFTPKIRGYNITLILSGDTARFFKNETIDSTYQFRIQRELEITGVPTDSLPVLVYYSFYTGSRRSYVPILICKYQLIMHYGGYNDLLDESIWEKN